MQSTECAQFLSKNDDVIYKRLLIFYVCHIQNIVQYINQSRLRIYLRAIPWKQTVLVFLEDLSSAIARSRHCFSSSLLAILWGRQSKGLRWVSFYLRPSSWIFRDITRSLSPRQQGLFLNWLSSIFVFRQLSRIAEPFFRTHARNQNKRIYIYIAPLHIPKGCRRKTL